MWRWPSDSPLQAKVQTVPLILKFIPPSDSPHRGAPDTGDHLVVLIEAGICVLGHGRNDAISQLFRTRRYMSRKSQGKAQIGHTPKAGRLSYGARLRNRESKAFFQEVTTALRDATDKLKSVEHVWWHCSPKIKGHLRKEDTRLYAELESRSSKLPGPIDVFEDEPLVPVWHKITHGCFAPT